MKRFLKNISKISIIVRNLNEAIRTYYNGYGVGPWKVFEQKSSDSTDLFTNDKNKNYTNRIAYSYIGSTQLELIEPMDNSSIFYNFLDKEGEGIHHLGYETEDFEEVYKFFTNKGLKLIHSGNWFGNKFAYFDTGKDLKHIIEIYYVDDNFKKLPPLSIYPQSISNNKIKKSFFKKVRQVGIVVNDIKETVKTYHDKYGYGPWELYKYYSPKVKDMYYMGKKINQEFITTAPVPMIGEVELELIEPESEKNIYADFLKKYNREGIQHVSFTYNLSFVEVLAFHRNKGHKILQKGNINGAIYIYVDTTKDLKFISEPLYVPQNFKMPKYDFIYPERI